MEIFVVALIIIGGLSAFYKSFQELLLKREIENIPTSRINSLAKGSVELKCKACAYPQFTSPITGTPCVYYCLELYFETGEFIDGIKKRGLTHKKSNSNSFFFVRDDSGIALVSAENCRMIMQNTFTASSRVSKQQTPELMSYLKQIQIDPSAQKWELLETVIIPGQDLYILGYADIYKKRFSPRLKGWLAETSPTDVDSVIADLFQSDYVNPDLIPPEELELVKDLKALCRLLRRKTSTSVKALNALAEMDAVCSSQIIKSQNSKWHIISDLSEKEIIKKLSRSSGRSLILGPIEALIGLLLLLFTLYILFM